MTLDDLFQKYLQAYEEAHIKKERWERFVEEDCIKAGIRAVVVALRNHLSRSLLDELVYGVMNEILASYGVEETPLQAIQRMGQEFDAAPAAAPVCEWTRIALSNHYVTGHGNRRYWDATCTMECGECHRPIKFKEGSE